MAPRGKLQCVHVGYDSSHKHMYCMCLCTCADMQCIMGFSKHQHIVRTGHCVINLSVIMKHVSTVMYMHTH